MLEKIGVNVSDAKDDNAENEIDPNTTFTTTNDLAATPYAVLTVSDTTFEDGSTAYDMTFVRTNDTLTAEREDCLYKGKQLAKVYTVDEENAYSTNRYSDAPWYNDAESIITVTVKNLMKPNYMNDWVCRV